MRHAHMLAIAVATALTAGCGGSTDGGQRAADHEAIGVCIAFYEVTDDVKAGILDEADAGPRLQGVWNSARNMANVAVRTGLRDVLAGLNGDMGAGYREAVRQVDDECTRLRDKYR